MKFYITTFFAVFCSTLLLLGLFFRGGNKNRGLSKSDLAESIDGNFIQEGSTLSLKSALHAMIDDKNIKNVRKSYGGVKADNEALAKRKFSKQQIEDSDAYFNKLIKTPQTAELYRRTKTILGSSSTAEAAAKWITLGGIFESTSTYGDVLTRSLQEANRNPKEIIDNINKSIQQVRNDPFIYQMTMNLIYQLSISSTDQSKFYGQEIEQQLKQLKSQEQPSDSFRVAELGLMLAKQAGVSGDDIEPYIKRGLGQSKGPSQILNEFRENATFYFPEMKL